MITARTDHFTGSEPEPVSGSTHARARPPNAACDTDSDGDTDADGTLFVNVLDSNEIRYKAMRYQITMVVAAVIAAATAWAALAPAPPSSRPFHLGFTRWPADISTEGVAIAEDFAHKHGDILCVFFMGGIPWPESLADKPFSKDVQDNLSYRPPKGVKLFLAISILDRDRKGIAPYWGEKDNMPLPKPWDKYALDSQEVRQAYPAFVLRAVDAMRPDYLAIGMENNILLCRDPAKWKQLKVLHAATYKAVKAKHPALPVFFTTEVLHYKKLHAEARSTDQEREVAEMMKYSDLFAMSVYPHMSFDVPRPVPDDFLDFAIHFGKPIAVSESGDTSREVNLKSYNTTLQGSESGQKQFTEMLLKTAAKDRYEFVITFATTDFPKLCDRLPPAVADMARIWAYTGMQTSEKRPKPALAVWDAYLKAKYDRP